MNKQKVNWSWSDRASQESFERWVGWHYPIPIEKQIDLMLEKANLTPPVKVLDIGCGTGNQSLEFARRGCLVHGLDVAESFLKQAIEHAEQERLQIHFELKPAKQMRFLEEFDFAYAINHAIGEMEPEDLLRHFSAIAKALRRGRMFFLFLADSTGKEIGSEKPVRKWNERDGTFIMTEKHATPPYKIERCIEIDSIKDTMTEYIEKKRWYSHNELTNCLTDAGFNKVEYYSGWDMVAGTEENRHVYICTT